MDLFASDRPGPPAGAPSAAESGSLPPPARTPYAGDLGLDDWTEQPRRSPPRRWLLAAAFVPWIVVGALLLPGDGDAVPTPAAPPASPAPSAGPTPPVSSPEDPQPTPSNAEPEATAASTVTTTTPGVDDRGRAVGLAVATARSWLSTRPTPMALDGLEPVDGAGEQYVEHLVVESVDHPARGALVVTVGAIVLPVDGDEYGPPESVRIGVPVHLTDAGPRPAGPPWWLPVDTQGLEPPSTEPVDDPDLQMAAVDAVTAAGYRQVELDRLERTDGWAWVAHVQARGPSQPAAQSHVLWLRADVGRFVVAGTTAPDADGEAPVPGPSTPDAGPTTDPAEAP